MSRALGWTQSSAHNLRGGYIYGTAYHQEESILAGTTD
jgi:hypothetical protein